MKSDRVVRSTCPYCGVGCQIDLHVKDDRIFRVDAPFDAAPNFGRLCVKGRFGTDFVGHPSRLTVPLIRRTPQLPGSRTPAASPDEWREASWDEALDLVAARLLDLRQRYGPDSITANASAKATNEDNYLLQKYLRAVIGTNNIDHCARLCHAGSVAGLQLALGSSAMSNAIAEMPALECFMVVGSNTAETHPVIATFLKQAVARNGARLIVVDPRRTEMTRFAELWLREQARLRPGAVHRDGAGDRRREAVQPGLHRRAHRRLRRVCRRSGRQDAGVGRDDHRCAGRRHPPGGPHLRGREAAAIYWGMGISQSTHGTENTLTLTNLALLCGHVGRPGTGLNPLRGQNNVQGCSDVGGAPGFYTAYQPVNDPDVRARFEAAWRVPLPAAPGLTTTEMVDGILTGQVKGWYVMGENPLMSEPNLAHARHAVEHLEFYVCPGHLLERDQRLCGRDPAGGQLRRARRDIHQLRPPRPARAPGRDAPRPGAARLGDHRRPGAAHCTANCQFAGHIGCGSSHPRGRVRHDGPVALRRPRRYLAGAAATHARLRRHQLRAAGAGGRGPLAVPVAGAPRHTLPFRRRVPAGAASFGRWASTPGASCPTPATRSS